MLHVANTVLKTAPTEPEQRNGGGSSRANSEGARRANPRHPKRSYRARVGNSGFDNAHWHVLQ